MKSRFNSRNNSGTDVVREYQRAGTFMVGFLARENLITLDALSDYWRQSFLVWFHPTPAVGYLGRMDSPER
ncbi:MAG: hypothetical protein ABI589_08335 [Burkholderiales bacterium]